MRPRTGLVFLVVLLAAWAQAAEQCAPASNQPAQPTAASDKPDDLAATLRTESLQTRIKTMQEWGFSLQELQLIRAYKRRMHAVREQLEDALQALAVTMYTEYEEPEQRKKAAQEAVERCRRLAEEDRRLQDELIERVGAKDDALKMAGLILLGAVDGGRRVMCEVSPGVAGGAQGAGLHIGPVARPRPGPPAWRWNNRARWMFRGRQPATPPAEQPQ